MLIALLLTLGLFVLSLIGVIYVLGFHVGGEHWLSELARVRLEAARAERRLHDLTREAFVAMAEHVEHQNER